MRSLQALSVALATSLTYVAASPAALAFAAGGAGDPYGENTPIDVGTVATRSAQTSPGGGMMAKTILGLGVVIAVIYGLTWVLRQMRDARTDRGFGGLSTEATIPLGPNRAVHLIRAGRELVLVGSAEHGVVPIRTYSEDEAVELGLIDPDDDVDEADVTRRGQAQSAIGGAVGPLIDRLRDRTLR